MSRQQHILFLLLLKNVPGPRHLGRSPFRPKTNYSRRYKRRRATDDRRRTTAYSFNTKSTKDTKDTKNGKRFSLLFLEEPRCIFVPLRSVGFAQDMLCAIR
jgi:hypothetical protein